MGRMKENPKYNILSFRAADADYFAIIEAVNVSSTTVADFLLAAANEKVIRDSQQRMDEYLRNNGL